MNIWGWGQTRLHPCREGRREEEALSTEKGVPQGPEGTLDNDRRMVPAESSSRQMKTRSHPSWDGQDCSSCWMSVWSVSTW